MVDAWSQSDLVSLWEVVLRSLQSASEHPNVVSLGVVLARHLGAHLPDADSLVALVPPEVQASIELGNRGTIPASVIEASLDVVSSVVNEQSRKAAMGSVSFGGVDSRHLLGLLIAAAGRQPAELVDALAAIAVQTSGPLIYRVGAMRGLIALAQLNHLPDQTIGAVRYMTDEPKAADIFGAMSPSLLRSLRCKLLATAGFEGLAVEALSLARHTDVETRLVAVEALGTLAARGDKIAQMALVSTLFDPSPIVVRRGVQGLSQGDAWHPEMESLILTRLLDLRSTAGVAVRQAIASLAARLTAIDGAFELQSILAKSRADRSWLVRESAEVGTEGTP